MPPRATSPAGSKSAGTRAAASRGAKEAPAAEEENAMKTFAEFTGSTRFPVVADNDETLKARTFVLPIGLVERVRATADGVQHRVYETPLDGIAPDSVSGSVIEALDAWCTYYEGLLNGGKPFRRVHRLPPGPSRTGAERGAAKRSVGAAAKREQAGKA